MTDSEMTDSAFESHVRLLMERTIAWISQPPRRDQYDVPPLSGAEVMARARLSWSAHEAEIGVAA